MGFVEANLRRLALRRIPNQSDSTHQTGGLSPVEGLLWETLRQSHRLTTLWMELAQKNPELEITDEEMVSLGTLLTGMNDNLDRLGELWPE